MLLHAGLNRCRKSCRLRWLNYLKPNIKRGNFAEDEVDLLLMLHKLLGNRQVYQIYITLQLLTQNSIILLFVFFFCKCAWTNNSKLSLSEKKKKNKTKKNKKKKKKGKTTLKRKRYHSDYAIVSVIVVSLGS